MKSITHKALSLNIYMHIAGSVQSEPFPNILPHNLLVLVSLFPPHACRVHICGTLIIRFRQHAHHANQNLFHALYRRPPFRRVLVVIRVVTGRV